MLCWTFTLNYISIFFIWDGYGEINILKLRKDTLNEIRPPEQFWAFYLALNNHHDTTVTSLLRNFSDDVSTDSN